MNKIEIRLKLKESLEILFEKKKKSKLMVKKDDINPKKKSAISTKKSYPDVQRAFKKLGGPSMVDIMKLIGIEDDDKGVNRSLFGKKVHQTRNPDTGSYYQFDDTELDAVRTALDIK